MLLAAGKASQSEVEIHELTQFLPLTSPSSCTISIPDNKPSLDGDSTENSQKLVNEYLSSDRPARWSVLRPSVLPETKASRSVTKSEELKPTLSQDALLDLAPHLKHRTVALNADIDAQGDFHAVMRAAKYDSLRRRDVVYVA